MSEEKPPVIIIKESFLEDLVLLAMFSLPFVVKIILLTIGLFIATVIAFIVAIQILPLNMGYWSYVLACSGIALVPAVIFLITYSCVGKRNR